MIPVTLCTPEKIWKIYVPEKAIKPIRALAETWGDTSEYCEIVMPDECYVKVPKAAIMLVDRMYQEGAFV